MTIKPRLGPDDPQILQAFSGVYKSSAKVFFRINPDGSHKQIQVFRELDGINITHDCKMEIIKAFPFEHLAYFSQRMKAALAAEKANRKPKPVRTADSDEDELADEEEADADVVLNNSKKNPEFFLVSQNNGYFGCFSAREGNTVAMFRTEREATAYIRELLQGANHVRGFYGSKVKAD